MTTEMQERFKKQISLSDNADEEALSLTGLSYL